jgi:ATP-dependent DNA helicase RecG
MHWKEKESKTLEFKSVPPRGDQIARTCVAFANGVGGEILIGIEDETGYVCGVEEDLVTDLLTRLPNSVYDSVSPPLLPHASLQNVQGKTVVRLHVFPGSRKPYFVSSLGPEKGVFVRAGASTRRAHPELLADLIREGRNTSFDEEASGYSSDVLSADLLSGFFGGNYTTRQLLADKIAVRLPANPELIEATWAGILLFSEHPEEYVSEAQILCTRFQGTRGRDIIQSVNLCGPIPVLAAAAQRLLEEWLARDIKIRGFVREASSVIPEIAIRETIMNALIHRKYTIPGPIKIALYEDRLEIFSPGAFPGLVSLKTLGDGTTVLRNPRITAITRKMKLVEKLGSGIRSVLEACDAAHLERPRYDEGPDFVKVTFMFRERVEPLESLDDAISRLLSRNRELRVEDLLMDRKESRNTITRRLNEWIKRGRLVRIGQGRGTRYLQR